MQFIIALQTSDLSICPNYAPIMPLMTFVFGLGNLRRSFKVHGPEGKRRTVYYYIYIYTDICSSTETDRKSKSLKILHRKPRELSIDWRMKKLELNLFLLLSMLSASAQQAPPGYRDPMEDFINELYNEPTPDSSVKGTRRPVDIFCKYHMECARPLMCLDYRCAKYDMKRLIPRIKITDSLPKCDKYEECKRGEICVLGNCRPRNLLPF